MVSKKVVLVCILLTVFYCNGSDSGMGQPAPAIPGSSNWEDTKDVLRQTLRTGSLRNVYSTRNNGRVKRRPMILVPGLGGSQLWAKLNKRKAPHFLCYRKTKDYFNIWLSLTQLIPRVIDCTVDNLRLHYNKATHTTHNTPGVDIQVLNFGHPKSVEWLDPYFDRVNSHAPISKRSITSRFLPSVESLSSRLEHVTASRLLGRVSQAAQWLNPRGKSNTNSSGQAVDRRRGLFLSRKVDFSKWVDPAIRFGLVSDLAYYSDMVNELVAQGYIRGKDLRAAPYDFRKAPHEMHDFFNKTKQLIEDTYNKNGKSRVVVVAHSMGNPVMLHFYNHVVSRQWKDKYIRVHVALAAPWRGAVKSLKLMVSGDSLGIRYMKTNTIRTVQRSMGSTAWLLPSPALWLPHQALVTTPRRNYTASDYGQLFRDMDYMEGYHMWRDALKFNSDLKFPDVELHCLYGTGVKTMSRLVYEGKEFPDQSPKMEMDDGDGTVNRPSLEAFLPWKKQSVFPVHSLALPAVNHNGILKNQRVIRYILELALN